MGYWISDPDFSLVLQGLLIYYLPDLLMKDKSLSFRHRNIQQLAIFSVPTWKTKELKNNTTDRMSIRLVGQKYFKILWKIMLPEKN